MKIRKLQLKNIGVFDDETIEFQSCPVKNKAEIHILTGENGSGKSTLLLALVSAFGKIGEYKIDLRNSFEKRFRASQSYLAETTFYDETIESLTKVLITDHNVFDTIMIERTNSMNKFSELFATENSINEKLSYCPFAYSGYRRIKDEVIEIGRENKENPLFEALNFVKFENSKFTLNQWLGQNLINSSLAKTKSRGKEANEFDQKISILESIINEVIVDENEDNKIKFEMQSATKLVLIKNNQELDFDVLPDGLKSLISWIGDLLMRLDSLNWKNDTPIFEREILLFLDEIEVHLHPAWQRKVLPVVQKLFKNAQIFVSTHSPFVVNSVDDAWVYELAVKDGKAKVREKSLTKTAYSIQTILREVFEVDEKFGDGIKDFNGENNSQTKLDEFIKQKGLIVKLNGDNKINKEEFLNLAKDLASQSAELQSIVFLELAKLSKKTGESYEI